MEEQKKNKTPTPPANFLDYTKAEAKQLIIQDNEGEDAEQTLTPIKLTRTESKISPLPQPTRSKSASPESKGSPSHLSMDFPADQTPPTLVIDATSAPSDTDEPAIPFLRHSQASMNLRALRGASGTTEMPIYSANRPSVLTHFSFGPVTVYSPHPLTPEPPTPKLVGSITEDPAPDPTDSTPNLGS